MDKHDSQEGWEGENGGLFNRPCDCNCVGLIFFHYLCANLVDY